MNEEFGIDLFIPKFENYPITLAEIQHLPFDNKELVIQYSKKKGELKSDAFVKKYEENMDSDVLYGVYESEFFVVKLTFRSGKGSSKPSETKIFNGIEVEYHKVDRNNAKALLALFNVKKGTYSITFNLKEISESKAFDMIDMITSKVK
ncbi:hypothetical protein [Virgibacillus ndiopensis]|uniref:hypothetical protein n=1 Tax=Virgibacillus ndiopensis TaxID=2004408 RepID=UPI000C06D41B|nr:hypothetical protein [Virgibacillus ndiopensis]